jgi:hypothetical protein
VFYDQGELIKNVWRPKMILCILRRREKKYFMPRHHILPATYLARFSDNPIIPTRNSKVYVTNVDSGKSFFSSVSNIACEKNFYSLFLGTNDKEENLELLEEIWAGYETNLSNAIDKLIRSEIDAITWVRVLIPFVTGVFVRNHDFKKRYENRSLIKALSKENVTSDINNIRLMEYQRLLAPITAAKWIVLNTVGDEPIINNDLGYIPFQYHSSNVFGYAIPLDSRHALAIIPCSSRTLLKFDENEWKPIIDYRILTPKSLSDFNMVIAQNAEKFIFGQSEFILQNYLQQRKESKTPPDPGQLGFISGNIGVAFEFTWHRLASFLSKYDSSVQSHDFSIDWNALKKGWIPFVVFPANLVEFPSALTCLGNTVVINFYDPSIFFSISKAKLLFDIGDYKAAISECEIGFQKSVNDSHRLMFKQIWINSKEKSDEKNE